MYLFMYCPLPPPAVHNILGPTNLADLPLPATSCDAQFLYPFKRLCFKTFSGNMYLTVSIFNIHSFDIFWLLHSLGMVLGAGYHMVIVKEPHCDMNKLSGIIQSHVPDARLESNISAELSYVLPQVLNTF